MPKIPIVPGEWRLVERHDLAKRLFVVAERCDRCGQRLRYIDVLEHLRYPRRIVVGRTCSKRLRTRVAAGVNGNGSGTGTGSPKGLPATPAPNSPLPEPGQSGPRGAGRKAG